jgi:hypothetical protein
LGDLNISAFGHQRVVYLEHVCELNGCLEKGTTPSG